MAAMAPSKTDEAHLKRKLLWLLLALFLIVLLDIPHAVGHMFDGLYGDAYGGGNTPASFWDIYGLFAASSFFGAFALLLFKRGSVVCEIAAIFCLYSVSSTTASVVKASGISMEASDLYVYALSAAVFIPFVFDSKCALLGLIFMLITWRGHHMDGATAGGIYPSLFWAISGMYVFLVYFKNRGNTVYYIALLIFLICAPVILLSGIPLPCEVMYACALVMLSCILLFDLNFGYRFPDAKMEFVRPKIPFITVGIGGTLFLAFDIFRADKNAEIMTAAAHSLWGFSFFFMVVLVYALLYAYATRKREKALWPLVFSTMGLVGIFQFILALEGYNPYWPCAVLAGIILLCAIAVSFCEGYRNCDYLAVNMGACTVIFLAFLFLVFYIDANSSALNSSLLMPIFIAGTVASVLLAANIPLYLKAKSMRKKTSDKEGA